jgi:hypothetical protein
MSRTRSNEAPAETVYDMLYFLALVNTPAEAKKLFVSDSLKINGKNTNPNTELGTLSFPLFVETPGSTREVVAWRGPGR